MINLLPHNYKENIAYARRNRTLRNWCTALILSLIGISLIIGGGYLFMDQSYRHESAQSEKARQHLKDEKLDETKAQLDEISANTKLALQVLSREILFSKLLKQLGASLPTGTSLQTINIDKVEGGITLKALAKDINSATQIQLNLADPENKIFQKADIESINCSSESSTTTSPQTPSINLAYPCAVQIRALFSKDNPYVYISNTTKSGESKQ